MEIITCNLLKSMSLGSDKFRAQCTPQLPLLQEPLVFTQVQWPTRDQAQR